MTTQKTVGLMADPGVAEKVADRVSEGLAHRLSEKPKSTGSWKQSKSSCHWTPRG